jgi:hypothetical protein
MPGKPKGNKAAIAAARKKAKAEPAGNAIVLRGGKTILMPEAIARMKELQEKREELERRKKNLVATEASELLDLMQAVLMHTSLRQDGAPAPEPVPSTTPAAGTTPTGPAASDAAQATTNTGTADLIEERDFLLGLLNRGHKLAPHLMHRVIHLEQALNTPASAQQDAAAASSRMSLKEVAATGAMNGGSAAATQSAAATHAATASTTTAVLPLSASVAAQGRAVQDTLRGQDALLGIVCEVVGLQFPAFGSPDFNGGQAVFYTPQHFRDLCAKMFGGLSEDTPTANELRRIGMYDWTIQYVRRLTLDPIQYRVAQSFTSGALPPAKFTSDHEHYERFLTIAAWGYTMRIRKNQQGSKWDVDEFISAHADILRSAALGQREAFAAQASNEVLERLSKDGGARKLAVEMPHFVRSHQQPPVSTTQRTPRQQQRGGNNNNNNNGNNNKGGNNATQGVAVTEGSNAGTADKAKHRRSRGRGGNKQNP